MPIHANSQTHKHIPVGVTGLPVLKYEPDPDQVVFYPPKLDSVQIATVAALLTKHSNLVICDAGIAGLQQLAADNGWLRANSNHGIGRYIEALFLTPSQGYIDTRPHELKQAPIKPGHHKVWHDPYYPGRREFNFPTIPYVHILQLAWEPSFDIGDYRMNPNHPDFGSFRTAVRLTLQALGLGYITPIYQPQASYLNVKRIRPLDPTSLDIM